MFYRQTASLCAPSTAKGLRQLALLELAFPQLDFACGLVLSVLPSNTSVATGFSAPFSFGRIQRPIVCKQDPLWFPVSPTLAYASEIALIGPAGIAGIETLGARATSHFTYLVAGAGVALRVPARAVVQDLTSESGARRCAGSLASRTVAA